MNQERFRYGYNGIEELTDFGLGLNHAGYRLHDPALGRWNSVDPQAASLMGMSPYNSMGNSPLMYSDPNGDFIPQLVGGLAGAGLNVFNNWQKIVANPLSAVGYIATGAGAGVAATLPGGIGASRAILASGNVITDVASGNIPSFNNFGDVASYAGGTAFNAFTTAGASKALGKLAEQGLKHVAIQVGKEAGTEAALAGLGGSSSSGLSFEYLKEISPELWSSTATGSATVTANAIDWGGRAAANLAIGGSLAHGNLTSNPNPSMVYHHTFTDGSGNFKTYTGIGDVKGERAWRSQLREGNKLGKNWEIYDSQTAIAPNRAKAKMVEQLMINQNRRVRGASNVINRRNPGRKLLKALNKIF